MNFLDRFSASTKITLGLKLLGLSGDEKGAVDSMISAVFDNPVVEFALAKKINSIESLYAFIEESDSGLPPEVFKFGTLLANKQFRTTVSDWAVTKIDSSEQRDSLYSALQKVASFEMAPWSHMDFKDSSEFIAEGPLALLAEWILNQEPNVEDEEKITICPHCNVPHMI
jgi:hypothetical protein